jgi:ligand-binding SRPBCC domain-containing protein
MIWVSEITAVKEGVYFVDEQRQGPYKMWHHEHWVEAIDKGTRMTDIITYQPPMGPLGAIANAVFIRKQLESVFEYRKKAMEELFGFIE